MTSTLPFIKMHGIGNDFVVVGPEDAERPLDWPRLAQQTGDRHFGVGHDGLLLVERADSEDRGTDFRMRMFNPDGSESEMCGNGIRCFAKYVYDNRLAATETLNIRTGAGVQRVRLLVSNGTANAVEVDMGEPIFSAAQVPVLAQADVVERMPLEVDGACFNISCVSMGNPHAVAVVDDVANVPLERIGPTVEHYSWFPRRVNFEIVQVLSRQEASMRVWERGAGITLACGSGACAVMAVLHRQGLVDDAVSMRLPGGKLHLHWNGTGGVLMTGPAAVVYRGEWPLH